MRLWTDVGWVGGVSIWAQDFFGILQYGTTKSPGILKESQPSRL